MFSHFLAILLVVFRALADNDTISLEKCDGVVFRGTYYAKVVLFENLWRPTNLLMLTYNENLFFSHTLSNYTAFDFSIMSCHIRSRNCMDFVEVPGGRAIAYDRRSRLLYFGGSDGIYSYDVKNNELKFFAEKGKSIWAIAVTRNIFYIEYPSQQLYGFIDDSFCQVSQVEVKVFFITSNFDIYFYNTTALYMVDVETKWPTILSDKIIVRQINENDDDEIFFGADDGIYMHDVEANKLIKVAEIYNVYGIAFAKISPDESSQLIYSDENTINTLVPSELEEVCTNILAFN